MRIFLPLLVALILWSVSASGQVWPGDVNNNGVVNNVDLLYLGFAHGHVGPARPGPSSQWEEQAVFSRLAAFLSRWTKLRLCRLQRRWPRRY